MDIRNEAAMLLAQDPYLEDEQKEALGPRADSSGREQGKGQKGCQEGQNGVSIREWLLQRQYYGWYEKLMKHLEEGDVSSFKNFLRVDPEMFRKLGSHLTPMIQKQDINYRKALPRGLKVAITLRFLATGHSSPTRACPMVSVWLQTPLSVLSRGVPSHL